jgi:hypothetical protein
MPASSGPVDAGSSLEYSSGAIWKRVPDALCRMPSRPAENRHPAHGLSRRPRRRTTRTRGRGSSRAGTINRVVVDASGDLFVDLEREAQAMLMRE